MTISATPFEMRGAPMKVSGNEFLSIPIHVQLKEQIKTLIHHRLYQPSERLPSVDELAGFLRMSRDTVEQAYSLLEQEGYISTEPGKGVFARAHPPSGREQAPGVPVRHVHQTRPEQSVDSRDFAEAAGQTKPVLLFVECNVPQAQEYAVELEKATGYVVKPCLVKDLELLGSNIQSGKYDLIVTTFLHIEEVKPIVDRLFGEAEPRVIACLLESNLQCMKVLQKLPPGSKVGIAGTTWEGAENLRQSIIQAGLLHVELIVGALEYPPSLDEIVEAEPALIVSTSIVKPYLQRLSKFTPLMEEDRCLSDQSVQYIRQYVETKRGASGKG